MMKVVYRDYSAASNIDAAYLAGLKGKTAKPEDIERYLSAKGVFRRNQITRKIEFRAIGKEEYQEVTDILVNDFWFNMGKECECKVIKDNMFNIIHSSFSTQYNPIVEYFENLPEWDGEDHIHQLAAMVEVEPAESETNEEVQQYFEMTLKKWIVGMAASVMKESSANHLIFILLGKQGIFKTTWLQMLLPPELRKYCYTKNNSSRLDKDDKLQTTENIVVVLEELDELQPTELNQLKALVTQDFINERAPYERHAEKRKKIASFCGSGNNRQILSDCTGNRRFLTFWINSIENPREHEYNYTGIYSQVMHLLDSGFRYWLDAEDMERQARQQASFVQPAMEEELLLTYYRKPQGFETPKMVKASNILERINAGIRQPLSPKKLAIILEKQGFEKQRNKNGILYKVIERTGEEINHGEVIAEHNDSDDDVMF